MAGAKVSCLISVSTECIKLSSVSVLISLLHVSQGIRGVEGNMGAPGVTGPRVKRKYIFICLYPFLPLLPILCLGSDTEFEKVHLIIREQFRL